MDNIDSLAFLLYRHAHGDWGIGDAIMLYRKDKSCVSDTVFMDSWNDCSKFVKNYYVACVKQYLSEYEGGKAMLIAKATNDLTPIPFNNKTGKPIYG